MIIHYSSTAAIDFPSTGDLSKGGPTSQHQRYAHILDDYSLFNIFSFPRPEILYESEFDGQFLKDGEWNFQALTVVVRTCASLS